MKKVIIIIGLMLITINLLSGCIHDTDIEKQSFYDGDIIVTIGHTHHVAKDDFILLNFYKNCTYIITISYNVGGTFDDGKRVDERFEIVVPFTPYSYRFERNIILKPKINIELVEI